MAINKTAKVLALGSILMLGNGAASAENKALLDTLLQNGSINQVQYDNLTKQKASGGDGDIQSLNEVLLQNGIINQAQYDELTKQVVAETKQEVVKESDDVIFTMDSKGFQAKSADNAFKFKVGGRIQVDANGDIGDEDLSKNSTEGVELRRARIYIKGVVWEDYKYNIEADFADNGISMKDVFLTYKGIDWLEVTVGNQKQPISMELQESSNDIMFTERSTVNALTGPVFDRAIGLHFKSSGKSWSAQLGFYGDNISPEKDGAVDEGWSAASRLTFAPINTKAMVLHLGAYGGYKGLSDSKRKVKFFTETTHMSNLKLTNVAVADVDGVGIIGAEAAYMFGPFSVQGEYAHEWVARKNGEKTLDLNAAYVQFAWTLTGEARKYKGSDGEFKYLSSGEHFSWNKNTWGAFELATRYGLLDAAYGSYTDGTREQDVTVALNWYLNNNVRLMADYRYAFDLAGSQITNLDGSDLDHGIHSFTFRTQFRL
ncbi:MAG: porin [Methyloprofundus sp.]|nr:porin [Methyloprofundus sp.]